MTKGVINKIQSYAKSLIYANNPQYFDCITIIDKRVSQQNSD